MMAAGVLEGLAGLDGWRTRSKAGKSYLQILEETYADTQTQSNARQTQNLKGESHLANARWPAKETLAGNTSLSLKR